MICPLCLSLRERLLVVCLRNAGGRVAGRKAFRRPVDARTDRNNGASNRAPVTLSRFLVGESWETFVGATLRLYPATLEPRSKVSRQHSFVFRPGGKI